MSTWLHKQKKGDLVDLCEQSGLDVKGVNSMKKDDLVQLLEPYLRANSAKLQAKAIFRDFYASASRSSPIKKETKDAAKEAASTAVETVKDVAKDVEARAAPVKAAARRRVTNASQAIADADQVNDLLPVRTPRAVQRVAASIPLPSTPQAVTNLIERQGAAFHKQANAVWKSSGLSEFTEDMRENLSSVHGVTLAFLALEAFALTRHTLPWRPAFKVPVPASHLIGVKSPQQVYFPDFFVLLTSEFWGPTALWLAVSLIGPMIVGYLFNLTTAPGVSRRHRYTVDPVAFNVGKALGAFIIFEQLFSFWTVVDPGVAGRVSGAIYGGPTGMLVGAGIGAFTGLYEAVLKK